MHFKHEYGTGYIRSDVIDEHGSIKDTLTITANVPLDPSDPDFDQQKATELETAAVEFSKKRPVDHIVFTRN